MMEVGYKKSTEFIPQHPGPVKTFQTVHDSQLNYNSRHIFLFNAAESFSEDRDGVGDKDGHIRRLDDIWKV